MKNVGMFVLMFFAINCSSQQMSIGGVVKNKHNGKPIDSSEVILFQLGVEVSKTVSNESGSYFIQLDNPGNYLVKVGYDDFSGIEYNVKVENGDSIWMGESFLFPPAFDCTEEVEITE